MAKELCRKYTQRILYIVSSLTKSGPTNQLLNIIKYLSNDKYEILVLTLSKEIQGRSVKKDFLKLGISVKTIGLGHIEGMFGGKKAVQRVIADFNPDIIHSNGIRADYIVSRIHLKAVWCATIRNYCREDYISRYGFLVGSMCTGVHLKVIKQMIYPICCSNSLKLKYEQKLDKKMYVIQNGTDIGRFCYDERKRNCLREKLGISKDTFVFISVGSLNSRKDPMTIINAFKEVKDKNTKLYMLGDGPLKETCETNQNSNIILVGRVDEVEEYLLMADTFVSAALSEGLPNSVLEAGAAGLPMILSDIPQHKEIWNNESEYIKFFHTGNVAELEQKIKRFRTLRVDSKVREDISDSIRLRFSSERMSQSYQSFYDFMLKSIN